MPTIARGSWGRRCRITASAVRRIGSCRSRSPRPIIGTRLVSTNRPIASCWSSSQACPQGRGARHSNSPATRARAKQPPARSTAPLAISSAGRVGSSGSTISGIQRLESSRAPLITATHSRVAARHQRPPRWPGAAIRSWAARAISTPAAGVAGVVAMVHHRVARDSLAVKFC
ncbi:MAG: hypothetical protein EBT32_05715 [Betaproteobacteria bacterium]|nr:hypothetical protein [Betaproteobacteria bacterium]